MKTGKAWETDNEWEKVQQLSDELGIELPEVDSLDDEGLCAWDDADLDEWTLDLGDPPEDLPL